MVLMRFVRRNNMIGFVIACHLATAPKMAQKNRGPYSGTSVRMNKLVNWNVKHRNELNKKVEAGILTFVLNIHNGTGVTVY